MALVTNFGRDVFSWHNDCIDRRKSNDYVEMSLMAQDSDLMDDAIACWFCRVCETLTLLAKAEAGECCRTPRRDDCPLRQIKPR